MRVFLCIAQPVLSMAALAGCSGASQVKIRDYPAPAAVRDVLHVDNASVRVWAEVLDWANESAICIRNSDSGEVRCKESFFSDDSGHGSVVSDVVWSPTGRHVAYQTYSSGGHQPYHSPISVLSIETCQSVRMQDILDRASLDWEGFPSSTETENAACLFWDSQCQLHFFAFIEGAAKLAEYVYDPETGSLRDHRTNPAQP